MDKTKLIYLQDMHKVKSQATIKEIINLEDGLSNVILDQTIFYPQGGGQPSDQGFIKSADAVFRVESVFKQDDIVYHKARKISGDLIIGQNVTLELDQDIRNLHSKLHTAGHLIDYALKDLGYNFESVKGYHFPNGSYVEYKGNLNQNEIDKLKATLSGALDKIINGDLAVIVKFLSEDFYSRAMAVDGYDFIFCGGTHIRTTKELRQIIIREIKNEKDNLRVSYALSD